MTNPAIRSQPNGDVDIAVPDDDVEAQEADRSGSEPEPTVDPANLDHPEELMGE